MRSGFSKGLNTNEATYGTDHWICDQVEHEHEHKSRLFGICELECLVHLIKQREEHLTGEWSQIVSIGDVALRNGTRPQSMIFEAGGDWVGC